MPLLDRVKERTGSDLSDAELQAMIDAIAAELDTRLGPAGPLTIHLGDLTDPNSRFRRTLKLARPVDTAEDITIVESEPGNTGDAANDIELEADDYAVLHGGRTLYRLTAGPSGSAFWAPLVKITYTPIGAQAVRDEATIKLIALDLSYRGLIKSERAGDYQWQGSVSSDSYATERESIILGLVKAAGIGGGMVMA
jgi:hypothetical protein